MSKHLKNVLDLLEAKALSNFELLDLINNQSNLMTYTDLAEYDSIEDAMGEHDALVLLFESKERFGHWCCVFRVDDGEGAPTIEFFDSYGDMPDDQLEWTPMNFRIQNNMVEPHLTALLHDATGRGYKIEYNDHKLQKHRQDTNTCGRWVAARLLLRMLNCDQFAYIFKANPLGLSPDMFVTLLTAHA